MKSLHYIATVLFIFTACYKNPPNKRDFIKNTIVSKQGEFQRCYDTILQSKPETQGRILVHWIISVSGQVSDVKIIESSVNDPMLENCVSQIILSLPFPPPYVGQRVNVEYPFSFKKAK